MTSLETSAIRSIEKTTTAAARTTAKRPWYSWLSAIAAALVGLYYLYFLALTPVSNLFAFAWLAGVVVGCFAAAAGFALNRTWGAKCLLVAVVLILPRVAFNTYSVYAIMSAGYSSGFAIRLLGSLIVAAASLYTAALSGVTLAAMWRSSERLAWAALVLLLVPLLLGLAILPTSFLAP